ncbi:hypothetical protein [Pantoea vagans]|uniref:hypothetical protein n=1 Tax=Pantoea vagans TaxID=470934 RepID=UPI000949839F
MKTQPATGRLTRNLIYSTKPLAALTARTSALIDEMLPKLHALEPLIPSRQQTDITDIVLWPLLRCLSIVKALSFPPAVRDYAVRLESRTGIPLLFNQAL